MWLIVYDKTHFTIGCIAQERVSFLSAMEISRSKEILSLPNLGIKAELGTELPIHLSCLDPEKFLGIVQLVDVLYPNDSSFQSKHEVHFQVFSLVFLLVNDFSCSIICGPIELGLDKEGFCEKEIGEGKEVETSQKWSSLIILPLKGIFDKVWLVFKECDSHTNNFLFF